MKYTPTEVLVWIGVPLIILCSVILFSKNIDRVDTESNWEAYSRKYNCRITGKQEINVIVNGKFYKMDSGSTYWICNNGKEFSR